MFQVKQNPPNYFDSNPIIFPRVEFTDGANLACPFSVVEARNHKKEFEPFCLVPLYSLTETQKRMTQVVRNKTLGANSGLIPENYFYKNHNFNVEALAEMTRSAIMLNLTQKTIVPEFRELKTDEKIIEINGRLFIQKDSKIIPLTPMQKTT